MSADRNRTSRTESGELGVVYGSQGATSANTGRYQPSNEAERFWSKVHRSTEPGECWLWQGQRNRAGYGHFRRTLAPGVYRTVKAHRYAYRLTRGPIPPGLVLDHLCNNPACVRPDHLEPVTRAENLRRRHARHRAAQRKENPTNNPTPTPAPGDHEQAAYRPAQAARRMGISRSQLYKELAAGRLAARKHGAATLIPAIEIDRWLDQLPEWRSDNAA